MSLDAGFHKIMSITGIQSVQVSVQEACRAKTTHTFVSAHRRTFTLSVHNAVCHDAACGALPLRQARAQELEESFFKREEKKREFEELLEANKERIDALMDDKKALDQVRFRVQGSGFRV